MRADERKRLNRIAIQQMQVLEDMTSLWKLPDWTAHPTKGWWMQEFLMRRQTDRTLHGKTGL